MSIVVNYKPTDLEKQSMKNNGIAIRETLTAVVTHDNGDGTVNLRALHDDGSAYDINNKNIIQGDQLGQYQLIQ